MKRNEKKINKILSRLKPHITGLSDLVGSAEPSPLFYILADKLGFVLDTDPDKILSERGVRIRRKLNPIIKLLGPLFLSYKQVIESRNDLLGIDGPDAPLQLTDEPVLWCPNHRFKDDVLASVLVVRHSYILFGSLPQFYNTFDGITAFLNGVIMCNRKVSSSKRASIENASKAIGMGTDMLVFPEGVWNKHPDKLLLDFWPGAYRIAKETGSKIIPVIHYLADPHKKYKGNVIHTVIAEPICCGGGEAEVLELLRDTIATWYWLLMERYGRSTRQELLCGFDNADDAYESYIAMHTGCVKYYDREIELCADYRPKHIVRPEDVWKSVAEIGNIHAGNAVHICYAQSVIRQEERRDFQRRY